MLVTVKVLFFAKSREIVGQKSAELDLPSPISYKKLLETLVGTYFLAEIAQNIILSLNEEFCDVESVEIVLKQGDEVAIIPPLSGG
ncbi:molybdopterin synthase sulfur carrier subunit [Tribolium castaneum]|uniref:molybdopterin synthase sulfur carrier subunit n=1 Tax=Tribolium castaneum TaxID=7070 RepID=UPI0001758550|nr:PREDICTED: molybdopterin synthase sulfur carrier subunit [Tribolium castaneum]|eukprot:XP_001812142.1 PREDICTED: molybdopterin synthase sulfur carrier subunit [Tribolium castaneum]